MGISLRAISKHDVGANRAATSASRTFSPLLRDRHIRRLDEIGGIASLLVSDIRIMPIVSDLMGDEARPGAIAFVPPVHDFPRLARLAAALRGIEMPADRTAAPIAFAADFLDAAEGHFFVDTVVHEVAHVVNNLTRPPGGWVDGRRQIHGHRWVAFAAALAARAGLPDGRDGARYLLSSSAARPDADLISRRFVGRHLEAGLHDLADSAFAAAPLGRAIPPLGEWTRLVDRIVTDWEESCRPRPRAARRA